MVRAAGGLGCMLALKQVAGEGIWFVPGCWSGKLLQACASQVECVSAAWLAVYCGLAVKCCVQNCCRRGTMRAEMFGILR